MKNKICHLTSAHPDGDIRIFHKSCVTLAKAGFETYCVVPNAETRVEQGVEIVSFNTGNSSRLKRFRKTIQQVLQRAIEINASVYHLHDPELLLIAKKLKKATGAKIIFDSHEDVPKQIMDKIWIPKPFRAIVSKFYATFERRACKHVDAIISVTPIICNRFSGFHPVVELVANYPDLSEFQLHDNQNAEKIPRSLCYIGGFSKTRGIVELVKTMELIDAELHLAGWFESSELEEEVKKLEGWKKVNYYGKISRSEVQNLLAQCQIGAVTLLPTASYKEAYPIKMFEYMAAGIPVLASDFPLWRTLVEKYNCAEFVDPCKPELIAQKLENLFSKCDLKQMGKNGRLAIQNEINWEHEGKKLIALYNRLIKDE